MCLLSLGGITEYPPIFHKLSCYSFLVTVKSATNAAFETLHLII